MQNIPISNKTIKVIDKIINTKNIPNTILLYNDYKNLGMPLVTKVLKRLIPENQNIHNNPDIFFIIPMSVAKKDYKETLKIFLENIKQNKYLSEEEWREISNNKSKKFHIGVDQINAVFENLSKKTFYGGHRFVIFWRPEKMITNTSNKILKMLEEPPGKTVFIFISKEHTKLLPTILSRTFKIKIESLKLKEYIDFVSSKTGISSKEAERAIFLFDGDYSKILKNINTKYDFSTQVKLFIKWMRICYKKDIHEINNFVDEISKKEKNDLNDFLKYCTKAINKCMFINNNLNKVEYLNSEEKIFLENLSPFIKNKYIDFLNLFENAIFYIDANINKKMLFYNNTIKMM